MKGGHPLSSGSRQGSFATPLEQLSGSVDSQDGEGDGEGDGDGAGLQEAIAYCGQSTPAKLHALAMSTM